MTQESLEDIAIETVKKNEKVFDACITAIYKAGWQSGDKAGYARGFEMGRSVLGFWGGLAVFISLIGGCAVGTFAFLSFMRYLDL